MQVKLKVVQGAHAGKELLVPVKEFLIGRSEECHLRPHSDLISRRHCALIISDEQVLIRDFGGKNGTFLNGNPVIGDLPVKAGDKLKIGPLEFVLVVEGATATPASSKTDPSAKIASSASANKPVGNTPPASPPAPVSQSSKSPVGNAGVAKLSANKQEDHDINRWLEEGNEFERELRAENPETRQFKLSDTERSALAEAADKTDEKGTDAGQKKKGEKKEYGKLPPVPVEPQSANSRDAAAKMLKQLFNRK